MNVQSKMLLPSQLSCDAPLWEVSCLFDIHSASGCYSARLQSATVKLLTGALWYYMFYQSLGIVVILITLITSITEKVLRGLSNKEKAATKGGEHKKVTVMLYMHKISHGLKKIGERHGVRVVFSAPSKMKSLCKKVHNDTNKSAKSKCKINHVDRFLDCADNPVYKIPFSCGEIKHGQTGRCINVRLKEHRYATEMLQSPGHLEIHCARHGCKPVFEKTKVLARCSSKKWTRKPREHTFCGAGRKSFYIHRWMLA